MFSFDDGAVHDDVQLVAEGRGTYPMSRVTRTTLYVVSNSVIQLLGRNCPQTYRVRCDGRDSVVKQYKPNSSGVKRHTLSYNGESTSYLKAGPAARPQELIYIVPGNPGLCEFYFDFAESLSQQFPKSLVICASYRGFDVFGPSGPLKLHRLADQVNHKLEFLDFILATHPSISKVALLGHSVGSWVCQRMAVQHESVKFVGLLTPTVHNIALSSQGQKFVTLTKLVKPMFVFFLVSALLMVLPFSNWLVSKAVPLLHPEVRAETLTCAVALATNPSVIYQVMGLAMEEMLVIGGTIEPTDIGGFWDRFPVFALFAENDHWVSRQSREALIEHARTRRNVTTEVAAVSHAFCLKESEAVSVLVANQIKKHISK